MKTLGTMSNFQVEQIKKDELNPKNSTRQITNESSQLGKDDFMKLLIAEMRNQDPLEPIDNAKSIAQLAQFSSLEGMEKLNKSFETLSTNQRISNLSLSANLIGKNASIIDNGEVKTGIVKATSVENNEIFCKIKFKDGSEKKVNVSSINKLLDKDYEEKYMEIPTKEVSTNEIPVEENKEV